MCVCVSVCVKTLHEWRGQSRGRCSVRMKYKVVIVWDKFVDTDTNINE